MKRSSIISFILIPAFALSTATWAAQAQTPEATVETLVVTGTRLETAPSSMPSHITVLDRATIERRNKSSVLELLREVDGIQVTQYGGRGGLTSVFLQGAEPNFTVVLLDGVKVNDPNNSRGGSFNFANLNLAEIERIEVLRGPQSSIYGSDALAGVINIVSRTPADAREASIALEGGADDLLRSSVHVSTPLGERLRLSATLSASEEGEAVAGNDYENRAATLRLRRSGRVSYDVSARWFEAESEAFPEDSGGPELAVLAALDERDNEQASLSAGIDFQATERVSLNLLASYLDQEEQLDSPGIAPGVLAPVPPNTSDAELERLNLTAFAVFNAAATLTLTGGVDYQEEDGSQTGSVELFPGFSLPTDFDLQRDVLGWFTEARYAPAEALLLSAALRHDDPDTADAETTLRLGAQWQQGAARLYATWGEAFKLPSFFALGHGLVGNPDLKPETSEGWQAGIDYEVNDTWQVGITAFANDYEDLIDFDFNLFTNVNRTEVETSGVEASTELLFDAWRIGAHLTYIEATGVVQQAGPLLDEAGEMCGSLDWRGGVNVTWSPVERVDLHLAWLHVGETFDSSIPTGPLTLRSYDRLDVSATWQVSDQLQLWLAADNAADASFEESVGFPAVGARARLGLRMRF